jgi:hypothetical protein
MDATLRARNNKRIRPHLKLAGINTPGFRVARK